MDQQTSIKRIKIVAVVIASIALATCIVFGVLLGVFIVNSDNNAQQWSIFDEASFIRAIKNSSRIKHHQAYYLTDDFALEADNLPSKPLDFYGTLEGNGHSITITGSNMPHPVFNIIKQGASVRRLKLDCRAQVAADKNKSDVALLAHTNNGTIENCDFVIAGVAIGGCNNSAAIVNYNFADIFNVCMLVNNVSMARTTETAGLGSLHFGTVTTVNHGSIANVLADVRFDKSVNDYIAVQINNRQPVNIGYLVGEYGTSSTSVKDVYVFEADGADKEFSLWNKVSDTQKYCYASMQYKGITKSFNDSLKAQADSNWNSYWNFDDNGGDFPTLAVIK